MNKLFLISIAMMPLFSIAQKALDGPELIFANEDYKTLAEAKMKYLIIQCQSNYSSIATYTAASDFRKKQIDWYIHQLQAKVDDAEFVKSLKNANEAWEKLVENDMQVYEFTLHNTHSESKEAKDLVAEKSYNLYSERSMYLKELMNKFSPAE